MPRVKTFDEKVVLEQAMELFWKKGYHATSIQDLVNHLGINRASLYDTYGGKEALFKKAFDHYRVTNSTMTKNFLYAEENIRKGFRSLFQMAIQQAAEDAQRKGCFVVNTTTELTPGSTSTSAILKENKDYFENLFHTYLLKGQQSGQLSSTINLKAIANLFFIFYNGMRVTTKVEVNPEELMTSVDELLSLLDQ